MVLKDPDISTDPERLNFVNLLSVKASTICFTCAASTVCPVTIPEGLKDVGSAAMVLWFLFYYKYIKGYCLSMFTKIVVSVVLDVGRGCAIFPIATNSLLLLYKPTVVTYGEKYDPVIYE